MLGYFNPTPINRVNNAMLNNHRFTYKCQSFLETSGQTYPSNNIKWDNFNPIQQLGLLFEFVFLFYFISYLI